MKKLLILCLLALPLLQSCQKTEVTDATVEAVTPNVSSRISVENDYLVFKSLDEFHQTLTNLKDLSNGELDVWENQFANFTSLRKFNNQMIDAYDAITNQQEEQAFWNTYKNLAVVDGEGILEPKLNVGIKTLLNTLGTFKVAGVIYRITADDKVLSIVDGDYSKMNNAMQLTSSNPENGIYLSAISREIRTDNNRNETHTGSTWRPYDDTGDPIGRKKMTTVFEIIDIPLAVANGMFARSFTVTLNIRSYYRGKSNWPWNQKIWRDKTTSLAWQGQWCVESTSGYEYQSPYYPKSAPLNDNDYTFVLQTGTTGNVTTPFSTGTSMGFCNSGTDVLAWMFDDGACCGLSDAWFSRTIQ